MISIVALLVSLFAVGFEVYKFRVSQPKFKVLLNLTPHGGQNVFSARIVNDGPDPLPLLHVAVFPLDPVSYDSTDTPVMPKEVAAHSSELFLERFSNILSTDPSLNEARFQVVVVRSDLKLALSNIVGVPVDRHVNKGEEHR